MRFLVSIAVCAALSAPAAAQDLPSEQRALSMGGLRALSSADDAAPWAGVGRLDTGVSFCTATLVTDRLVLTAAHCLFHPRNGTRIADAEMRFLVGLRNGRPEAVRRVRDSVIPDGYVPRPDPTLQSIGEDLALLRLDLPVGAFRAEPIPPGRRAAIGSAVTVVSYGADREAHASIEEGCLVLEGQDDVRLLSCEVVQGSSGAPVVRMTEVGPEVVAVISATARDGDGQNVSMAVVLGGTYPDLLAQVESGPRLSPPRVAPLLQGDDGGRSNTGALFIRP